MIKPDFSLEIEYWARGYPNVGGMDEVGRGSLAGPVVAACCCLKGHKLSYKNVQAILRLGIDDSKKTTEKKRLTLLPSIKKYFYLGIGSASVSDINNIGIVKATYRAMRRAYKNSKFQNPNSKQLPVFLLIDGFRVPRIGGVPKNRQLGIIDGDQKSISIAAASIVAKIYRDNLMKKMARKYPLYHWELNKGYGTGLHRVILRKNGSTKFHRKIFIDSII